MLARDSSKRRHFLKELSGKIRKRKESEESTDNSNGGDDEDSKRRDTGAEKARPIPPTKPRRQRVKSHEHRRKSKKKPSVPSRGTHRRSISSPDVITFSPSSSPKMTEVSRVSTSRIRPSERVPRIVVKCVEYLNTHGTKVEGIFRINGDLRMAKSLLDASRRNNGVDLYTSLHRDYGTSPDAASSRTIASLLKMFFRSMDAPIFPFRIYKEVLRNSRNGGKLKSILTDRTKFPQTNYDCLAVVLQLCCDISAHSASNKMTPNALSICWAPSLLRAPPAKDDFDDSMMFAAAMDAGKRNKVIETVISNFADIFIDARDAVVPKPSRRDSTNARRRARRPPPQRPDAAPSSSTTTTAVAAPRKKKVIYGVPMFGGGAGLHEIITTKRVPSRQARGRDEEEDPEEEDSEEEDPEEEEEDPEERPVVSMLSDDSEEEEEEDDEEADDSEEGGGDSATHENVNDGERLDSKDDDDDNLSKIEEDDEEEIDDSDEEEIDDGDEEEIDGDDDYEDGSRESTNVDTPETPIPFMEDLTASSGEDVADVDLYRGRRTPKRKNHESMRTCPLRRALVKGSVVPRPPTPMDESFFREVLISRPTRRVRLPGTRSQMDLRVLKKHHGIAEFFDDVCTPDAPSPRVADASRAMSTRNPGRLVVTVATPFSSGTNDREDVEDDNNTAETDFEDGDDEDDVAILSDRELRESSFFGEKASSSRSILVGKIDQLQRQLSESNEIVRRLEQQMATMTVSSRRGGSGAGGDLRSGRERRQRRPGSATASFASEMSSSMTTATTTGGAFVYAQGKALRLSGWSLFSGWKKCFLRVEGSELLCWDSIEDAIGGKSCSFRMNLDGANVNLCDERSNRKSSSSMTTGMSAEHRNLTVQIAGSDGRKLTIKSASRRGGAYWFSRLSDKTAELAFESDLRRRVRIFQRQTSKHAHPELKCAARAQFAAENRLLHFLAFPSAFSSKNRPAARALNMGVECRGKSAGVSDAAIQTLQISLSNHFYLSDLCLRGAIRGSRHLDLLSGAIKSNTSLRRLDLSENAACFERGLVSSAFVTALRSNRHIRVIALDDNNIGRVVLSKLCPALRGNVEDLSLASNRIDNRCCELLEEELGCDDRVLRRLNLASNAIGFDGVKHLTRLFRADEGEIGLEEIDLSENEIDDNGATFLADVLELPGATLQALYLDQNPLTSKGSKALASMVRRNRSIMSLSFGSYNLTESTIQALRVMHDFGFGAGSKVGGEEAGK
eukprot:g3117.t1